MDPLDQLIYCLENESDESEDAGDTNEQLWMRTHLRSVRLPWLRVHEFLLVYVQFKYTEDRLVLREDCWTFKKKLIVTFATPMLQHHYCLKLISAVLNFAWLSTKEDWK